ncbi:MAG: Flp pilus assembly protein pilin Flp [Alphaproteobacteria bacterium]|jgi:pilus assembly protein Flp/PilA|nr:Flp pilus assembly protein pilin Flp [Alphaproteobacteria bacterium]
MRSTFNRLIKDESGATMIEYGLIAALISVAAITALTAMGTSVEGIFNFVSGKLQAAMPAAEGGEGGEGGVE